MKKAKRPGKTRCLTVSYGENHEKLLNRWKEASGLSLAAIVRLLIEEHADCRLAKSGLFGWHLERPKFREGEVDHE